MGGLTCFQGRVTALTAVDAEGKIRDKLRQKGFTAAKVSCYPCPVQPWKGTIWWEYQVLVQRAYDLAPVCVGDL